MSKGLTDRQARFVEEYLVDLSATQAAIRAGYSEQTAGKIGWENLQKPHIAEAVAEAQRARADRTHVTQDVVLSELYAIACADMAQFAEWNGKGVTLLDSHDLGPTLTRCVAEVSQSVTQHGGTIRFKLHDKIKALELLGKHLGMFTDRLDVTVDGGVLVVPGKAEPEDWSHFARRQQALVGMARGNGGNGSNGGNGKRGNGGP